MTAAVVIAAVAVVVVIGVIVLFIRRDRAVDGVEQFQRQIDALSPEARRPVVDQVHQLDERAAEPDPPDAAESRDPDGGPAGDPDGP